MEKRLKRPIGKLVMEDSRAVGIFYKYGIDFCCSGNQTLEHVCQRKNIDPLKVLDEIEYQNRFYTTTSEALSISELTDHIIATHHDYLVETFPTLHLMAQKIEDKHGDRVVEIHELNYLLYEFEAELHQNMRKEEQVLFPYVKKLEEHHLLEKTAPMVAFGSVSNPIKVMIQEHHEAAKYVEEIRNLTLLISGYDNPCATMQVFLNKVEEFVKNMMVHLHLENNILFNAIIELEAQVRNEKV